MKSVLFFFLASFFIPLNALTWTAALDLSDASSNASAPQVGIDGSGNGIVTWQSKILGSLPIVKVSIKDSGTWPTTPTDLFTNSGYGETDPSLSINSSGNAIILASLKEDTDYIVKACVRINDSWLEADGISLAGSSSFFEEVSINDSNNGLAVWRKPAGDKWEIRASLYNGSTNTWAAPITVSSMTNNTYDVLCFLDNSGDGLVTWRDMLNDIYSIQSSELTSGTFSTPSTISVTDNSAHYNSLDGNSSGNAISAWTSLTGPSWNTAVNIYSSGSWGIPEVISEVGRNDDTPQVAMNSNGDAVVVWTRREQTYTEIRAIQLTNGTWSSYKTLSNSIYQSFLPQVAIDDNGNAVAVWICKQGKFHLVYGASYTPLGGWTAQELLSDTSGTFSNPKVAINASGKIVVAFQKVVKSGLIAYNNVIQVRESAF